MINSYWKLFSIPGAINFSTAAFLGRLPGGMITLAIMLPLSILTGSYTIAGAVVASTMIGMALCAPFSGRLVDRYGQRQILFIFAALNFFGISTLIASIQFDAPLAMLCISGAITGGSRVATGTLARTRWSYVTRTLDLEQRKNMLQTAYAFESMVDEIVFISGPILATFLSIGIHPLAGLVCCLIFYLIGTVTLAVQRKTQPTIELMHGQQTSALNLPILRVIFAVSLFIGISAGAVEVITVARANYSGWRTLTGILMATLAFSSMLAGFWYGARIFKLSTYSLWIRCLGLLVLALLPLMFALSPLALALALFIAGLLIAPSSIAGQVLIERTIPIPLLNEALSIVVTGMILGMAIGGWLSGLLIDKFGMVYTGILPAGAAFAALIIAIARRSAHQVTDERRFEQIS